MTGASCCDNCKPCRKIQARDLLVDLLEAQIRRSELAELLLLKYQNTTSPRVKRRRPRSTK